MRIKYGQSFTIRGLFSRRSKRGRKAKRCSTTRDDNDSSAPASTLASTICPPRLQSIQLSKELEILGLLTDRRIGKGASSASWLSASPASTLHATASPSPAPCYSLFPVVHKKLVPDQFREEYEYDDDDGYDTEQEQPIPSRQKHQASYPTSPLLPPPPSLLLQARSPAQEQVGPSVSEAEPEACVPLSPTLSYRTFVTRSSGIFPWGTEPHVAEEDAVSEVLVLPSPPQFAHSSPPTSAIRESKENQGPRLIDAGLKINVELCVSVECGGEASINNPTLVPYFIVKHKNEHPLINASKDTDMAWTILRLVDGEPIPGFPGKA
ncbi:hypothetical protein BDV10DRAFT_181315 [Aspergillus recurvatus]